MPDSSPALGSFWARILPPSLVALAQWVIGVKLIVAREPQDLADWKILGLAFPVFWLASIGPQGLVRNGGWLTRGVRALCALLEGSTSGNLEPMVSRLLASFIALLWLAGGLLAGSYVQQHFNAPASVAGPTPYYVKLLFALMHAGITASLGVFVFLAMIPEEANPESESSNESSSSESSRESSSESSNGESSSGESSSSESSSSESSNGESSSGESSSGESSSGESSSESSSGESSSGESSSESSNGESSSSESSSSESSSGESSSSGNPAAGNQSTGNPAT